MSLRTDYSQFCSVSKSVWKYLQNNSSKSFDDIVTDICSLRLYKNREQWVNILSEVGCAFVEEGSCDYSTLKKDKFKDLKLFSEDGKFLLEGRYVLPIKDMEGNVISLVGWYPDKKKYITLPTKYFVRNCLFFGMEQFLKTGIGKDYIVVEGIFDSLSVRSLGLNCLAQMGLDDSPVKVLLYGLCSKTLGIPDRDKGGQKVIEKDKWRLPINGSYLYWTGDFSESVHVKDIDDLIKLYDSESIRLFLLSCFKEKSRKIRLEL